VCARASHHGAASRSVMPIPTPNRRAGVAPRRLVVRARGAGRKRLQRVGRLQLLVAAAQRVHVGLGRRGGAARAGAGAARREVAGSVAGGVAGGIGGGIAAGRACKGSRGE